MIQVEPQWEKCLATEKWGNATTWKGNIFDSLIICNGDEKNNNIICTRTFLHKNPIWNRFFHSVPPSLWHHFRPYLIAVLHPMHLERKIPSANSQVDRSLFFKPRAKPKGRILRITCKSTKQLATKAAHFEESLEFALDGFQVVLSSILSMGFPENMYIGV